MSTALEPSKRRHQPVRVADVPVEKRRRAAREVIRREDDPLEQLRILVLAENPGNLIAWIAP